MTKRSSAGRDDLVYDVVNEEHEIATRSGPVKVQRIGTEAHINNQAELDRFLGSEYHKGHSDEDDLIKIREEAPEVLAKGKMFVVPHAGERYAMEVPVTEQYGNVAEAISKDTKIKKFRTVAKSDTYQDLVYDDKGDVKAVRLGVIPNDIGGRRLTDQNDQQVLQQLRIEDADLRDIATMALAAGGLPDMPPKSGGRPPG